MNRKHLDQALAQLADALESQNSGNTETNPLELITNLPDRAISGDKINGGKILNFSSAGIQDNAKKTQLTLSESGVEVDRLKVGIVSNDLNVEGTIKADTLEVKHLNANIQFDKKTSIEFDGHSKGLIWKGQGNTKQFILTDRGTLFSSESIDVHDKKYYAINGNKVLDETELGPSVTKSNIRELGRLKGLAVDGHVNINSYLFYNADSDRIGLGTEEPKAALTVAEDMIEVSLGTKDESKGFVGTHQNVAFDIVTGDTTRISISGNGNIEIGSVQSKTTIHGNVGINVSNPDNRVDLHVNGAIRFNDKLHLSGDEPPQGGAFNKGDIVWNSKPSEGNPIGWVCTRDGAPGIWRPFGIIS
jgi:predicted transcriptional regulator